MYIANKEVLESSKVKPFGLYFKSSFQSMSNSIPKT